MENNESTRPGLTPLDFYRTVWTIARKCFFDQTVAAKLDDWEHSCDEEIERSGDAVPSIHRMLAELEDSYTCLEEPGDTTDDAPPDAKQFVESRMLLGSIGYLRIKSFGRSSPHVFLQVEKALREIVDAKAFIIDLRGNTGGLLLNSCRIAALFTDRGPMQIYQHREPDEGYFEACLKLTDEGFEEVATYESGKIDIETWDRFPNLSGNKPLAILMDRRTASTSELFTGTIRDNRRVVLVGTPSYGKGIGQSAHTLANGYTLEITDARFLPPSRQFFGNAHQGVQHSIVPDILVEVDENSEDDVQLAAAVHALSIGQLVVA
jgi:C-terminal processing protease CtpA/Prc